MARPIAKLQIDTAKIDKTLLYQGKKTKYLNVALWPNKDGQPGEYGDDGYITQEITKEQREAGLKGPIIGNYKLDKDPGAKPAPKATAKPDHIASPDDDDLPF